MKLATIITAHRNSVNVATYPSVMAYGGYSIEEVAAVRYTARKHLEARRMAMRKMRDTASHDRSGGRQ